MQYFGYVVAYNDGEGYERPYAFDWSESKSNASIIFSNNGAAEAFLNEVAKKLDKLLALGKEIKKTKTGYLWWKKTVVEYSPLKDHEFRQYKFMRNTLFVKRVKIA